MTAIAPYQVPSFVDTCFSHKHLEYLNTLPGFSSLRPDESSALCCLGGMLEAAESLHETAYPLDKIARIQWVFAYHFYDYFYFVRSVMESHLDIDCSPLFPACPSLGIYDSAGVDDFNEFISSGNAQKVTGGTTLPLQTCLSFTGRSFIFITFLSDCELYRSGDLYPDLADFDKETPTDVINRHRFFVLCRILGVCECCLLPDDECLTQEQDRPETKPLVAADEATCLVQVDSPEVKLVDGADKATVMQYFICHTDLTKEEIKSLCLLPGILEVLDSLRSWDGGDIFCHDEGFIKELFRHYRFMWWALGVMEDHPQIDFFPLFSDYGNLSLTDTWEDGGEIEVGKFMTMFQEFMYLNVSAYRDVYRRFLLTGSIIFIDHYGGDVRRD